MNFLSSAFIAMCFTVVVGACLFVGYTFRIRIRYPFALVITHVAGATLTVILFTIFLVHRTIIPVNGNRNIFALVSYSFLLVTFVTGLVFFIRYDFRRRYIGIKRLSLHIVMAAFTVFSLSGTTAIYTSFAHKDMYHVPGSAMYNVHKHASVHQK